LPGSTRAKARDAFLAPLKRSLSCVTPAQLLVSRFARADDEVEALALSEDPLCLRSARLGSVVQLQLRQQFRILKNDREPRSSRWHVSTCAYFYQLDDESGRELAAWHWHPGVGVDYPHLHTSGGPLGKAFHLPTGRVSIESVLSLLLGELAVKPTRSHEKDWDAILRASERRFIEHRRWHA
jgi:hypothetical protein